MSDVNWLWGGAGWVLVDRDRRVGVGRIEDPTHRVFVRRDFEGPECDRDLTQKGRWRIDARKLPPGIVCEVILRRVGWVRPWISIARTRPPVGRRVMMFWGIRVVTRVLWSTVTMRVLRAVLNDGVNNRVRRGRPSRRVFLENEVERNHELLRQETDTGQHGERGSPVVSAEQPRDHVVTPL